MRKNKPLKFKEVASTTQTTLSDPKVKVAPNKSGSVPLDGIQG